MGARRRRHGSGRFDADARRKRGRNESVRHVSVKLADETLKILRRIFERTVRLIAADGANFGAKAQNVSARKITMPVDEFKRRAVENTEKHGERERTRAGSINL